MQNRLSILLRYISDNADEGFKMILHREEVGGARSTTKDEEKGPAFQPPASSNQYVFPANLIFIVPIFPLSLDYWNSTAFVDWKTLSRTEPLSIEGASLTLPIRSSGWGRKTDQNDELGAGSNYLAGAVRLPFVRVLHACKKCTIIYACAALARHIIEQKR